MGQLTTFLKSIADSIREKTGYSGLINPQEFKNHISNIKIDTSDKTIVFYDYDGTILYQYSPEEFLALGEMPKHPDAIAIAPETKAVGWGWTYQEACDWVSKYEVLELEAKYTVDGEGNRYYINVTNEKVGKPLMLTYGNRSELKFTLDWGNGSTYTFDRTSSSGEVSYYTISTVYNSPGIYVIKTTGHSNGIAGDGGIYSIGWEKSHNDCFLSVEFENSDNAYAKPIGIYNTSSESTTFGMLNPTNNGNYFCGRLFYYGTSGVNVYNNVAKWQGNRCAIPLIFIVGGVSLDDYFVCNKLYCSGYSAGSMKYVYAKELIFTTEGMTIGARASTGDNRLIGNYAEKIVFPKGVIFHEEARLGSFKGVLDFTKCTAIPSITTTFFPNVSPTNAKILVPKSLEENWKNATNWSAVADYIVGV